MCTDLSFSVPQLYPERCQALINDQVKHVCSLDLAQEVWNKGLKAEALEVLCTILECWIDFLLLSILMDVFLPFITGAFGLERSYMGKSLKGMA